jgi:hypothetical protein
MKPFLPAMATFIRTHFLLDSLADFLHLKNWQREFFSQMLRQTAAALTLLMVFIALNTGTLST